VSSIAVVLINIVVCLIFEKLGPFSRYNTQNKQTESVMVKILVFQFVNIAVVPILIQFNFDIPFVNQLGLFEGKY